MSFLEPLLPKPIVMQNDYLSGKLYIDADIDNKEILFRFRFDSGYQVAPVLIHVKVLDKEYQYICNRRDLTNPDMITPIIHTDYDLSDTINISLIEPMVSYGE